MQVSESSHQSYFENQQSGENKKKICVGTTGIININKGDTVESFTCSAKPCQVNKNLFVHYSVVSIQIRH